MDETADGRPDSEAVRNARQRVEQLAAEFGTRHPEYASGLNQLALLQIMQGDATSAEALLRQALEVRREALGGRHPEYATNLSSLAGLLWARGDLDGAEPLLREAYEVRSATLGPAHPKSVVSQRSLEQLLTVKRDQAAPADGVHEPPGVVPPVDDPSRSSHVPFSPPPPPPTDPPDDRPAAPPMSAPEAAPNGQQLAARLESLRSEFEALSRRVAMAAEGLRTRVSPPDADLLTACAAAHAGFDRLGEDFRRAIDAHGLPWPSEGLSDLEGLGALLTPLYAAEDERIKGESLRRGVIAVLDRVERLSCPAQPDFPPLAACLEQARGIRRAVEGSPPGGWPVVAHEVSEGRHPLNALLALITADESTGDEAWSGWYDAVVDAFGNPLAVAVARGRVVSPVP